MRLNLGAHVSVAGGLAKAVERARFLGIDVAQIFTKSERQWIGKPLDPDEVDAFGTLRHEAGLATVVSHDSYLINLATGKPDGLAKSTAAFADELDRAERLGLLGVVTHPGAHLGDGIEVGIERFATALDGILDRHAGKTKVLLETTAGQGTSLGAKFEEIAAIINGLSAKSRKRVGVCLDTCHAFAAGYDLSTESGFRAAFAAFDRAIGLDRLLCLHVNDSKKPLGSRVDRHEHIGQGLMGETPFRLLMTSAEFRGIPKILETEKSEDMHEDVMNLGLLRGFVR